MKRICAYHIRFVLLALALVLSACSSAEQSWSPPAQQWQNMSVRIETRPTQLRTGMNEFLVIVNRQQKGFSSDLMVNVKTEHSGWKQAMPDGALGVFRRALPIQDVHADHLYIQLIRNNKQKEMVFALSPKQG